MINRKAPLMAGSAITVLLAVATTPAAVILNDPLNHSAVTYPTTLHNINTGTNGAGIPLANPWQTSPANSTILGLRDLSIAPLTPIVHIFPNGEGTLVSQRGIRAQIVDADNPLHRNLGTISSPTIYVGFPVRKETVTGTGSLLKFWFDNTASGTHTSVPGFGIAGQNLSGISADQSVFAEIGTGSGAGARQFVPVNFSTSTNSTWYFVCRLEKAGGSSTYNRITVFLNPSKTSENDPGFTAQATSSRPAGGGLTSFNTIGFRTVERSFPFLGANSAIIGPILIGETFLEAFPPEQPPLAVDLLYFTATETDGGVSLSWETSAEIDNAGFNVYYSSRTFDAVTEFTKLNDVLIPAIGDNGGVYGFNDPRPIALGEERTYYLEDVELGGVTTLHTATILGEVIEAASSVNEWTVYAD